MGTNKIRPRPSRRRVLIAISTSGCSANILRAIGAARERGLTVVGFSGRAGGEMASLCDYCLHAPSDSTPLIQQIHITAGHIICGLIEERLFPRARTQRATQRSASARPLLPRWGGVEPSFVRATAAVSISEFANIPSAKSAR